MHPRLLGSLSLALVALLGVGCASSSQKAAYGPPPSPETLPYQVGPPDQLSITILPDPVIERQATVRPDGMISIDLVGDVPAAGRTTTDIANDIQQRIARFKRDASVTVSLSSSLSTEVTVLGEIRASTFPLQRETRLIEAIGIVGGTRQMSKLDDVRIIRVDDGAVKVLKADIAAIQRGDLATNYTLRGGDIIYVPPTTGAKIGYWVQEVFFPFQQVLGMGARVGGTVMTGGLSTAAGAALPRP
ncbi:MAG TPA: polysaccharide biosynthesis/export family protein [Myxococcota bacterium]|nr:polysaccharide biosynthesis/export family protein [Myxococcota bacterium]